MKNYQTLLFDVDDTLLDFKAAEKDALKHLFKEQNLPLSPEIEEHYKAINHELWRAYEEGAMNRDEVVHTRFAILFKEYGMDVDGVKLNQTYWKYLQEGHQQIQGAYELLADLKQHYDLYVVTNGVPDSQYRRLRDSRLFPMFKDIFVSEDTGYQKPMKEFFDYVFSRIPDFSVEQGLIIGDSLTSDIKGGITAGLDTCWFNPNKKQHPMELAPDYQIHHLTELYSILNREGRPQAVNQ